MADETYPSEVDEHVSVFDRFAAWSATQVARAPFFTACVLLIVVWALSYFVFKDLDTWQLVVNTATTIITFLLLALLTNSQARSDAATQHKLNAIAEALASVVDDPRARVELLAAVGLEDRESS